MRVWLVAALASLLLASCSGAESPVATSTPPAANTRSPEDFAPGSYVFIDQATNAYFDVELEPSLRQFGNFLIAVPGGGLFIPDGPATVTKQAPRITLVTYEGPARFDRDPVFNSYIGLDWDYTANLSTNALETGQIQLVAIVDEVDVEARVTLTFEGHHFELNHEHPPRNADEILADMTVAMARGDWAGLYEYLNPVDTESLSLDEFEDDMDELVAASGPIESVEVVSSVDYSTWRLAGFHGATVDIKIVQHDGTTETISWARVRMIYKRDAWRISDLVPPERIKDSEPPLPQSDRSE